MLSEDQKKKIAGENFEKEYEAKFEILEAASHGFIDDIIIPNNSFQSDKAFQSLQKRNVIAKKHGNIPL